MKRIVDFIHAETDTKIALPARPFRAESLDPALAGKILDAPLLKSGNWGILSASALPWSPRNQVPRAMTRADMAMVRDQFVGAAEAGRRTGFDWLELHYAARLSDVGLHHAAHQQAHR